MTLTFRHLIKSKLIFIAFGLAFLLPLIAQAQTSVSFTWDPNPKEDNVAGYRVFHRIAGGQYNYSKPVWEGAGTSCAIEIADQEGRHFFVARAFDTQGFESQNSDEACLGCASDTTDTCPNDPNKTEPGTCGCGIPDIDTDRDGTLDCDDRCPDDPDKIKPGVNGCGFPESINDNSPPENNDNCPYDPNKTKPGTCGCGIPDIDTDRDGTLDCNDRCPDDPNKIKPGVNGCGFSESSNDNSPPEDSDNCPNDPNKDEPGICGCGVVDIEFDTDEDGAWDCNDADDDNDGINDKAEKKAPNQGDANWDGIPDSLQCNVGSIKTNDGKSYISMESSEGTCIRGFKRVDTLPSEEFPEDTDFIYGLYEFAVHNTGYGKSVVVTITLPQGAFPNTFYIYGKTSENRTDHWYEFLDDGQTGAEIDENNITLFLTDARKGDNLLTKDGKIVGLWAPGYPTGTERAYNPDNDSATDSGSSSCFVDCLTQ